MVGGDECEWVGGGLECGINVRTQIGGGTHNKYKNDNASDNENNCHKQ